MVMGSTADGRPRVRVVLCHLESLTCFPAINRLFTQMGNDIGLVILSDRFGSSHGGLLRQFVANVGRSGVRLTLWLGFDIVAAQIAGRIAEWIERLTVRRPRLASVRALARRHSAAVLDVADINAPEAIGALRAYAPDVVVVMNFDQILRPEFIAAARAPVINVHPSLLPALRGPCPVFWALAEGHPEVGVSLHLIENERIDAGAVLVQRAWPIDRKFPVAEITAALFDAGAALVPDAVKASSDGYSLAQVLDPGRASYRGFPDRIVMKRSRRAGVRLCRFRYLATLLAKAVGIVTYRPL